MEPTIDMEELPFVIFYQCRMCTHLFFDDIEKMFQHLEERHGAMIDCEELKTLVYTNGLKLGPPPPSGSSDAATEGLEQETNVDRNGDDLGLIDEDDDDPATQLVIPEIVHGQTEDEDFVGTAVYDDDEADYQEENGHLELQDVKYHFKVHDDEEQLPEREFEEKLGVIGNNGSEELYDSNDDDTQNAEELETIPQGYNYDQVDYEEYDEDNSAEASLEGVEYEDYEEEDEMAEEEQDEDLENGNGTYSSDNGSQQQGQLVNYGYSCKFCGKFFTTQRGLQSHEQHHKIRATQSASRPNQPRRFPCKLCKNKTFNSFKDLKHHIKSHTTERIHVCKFCFSTFNNTASLTKHLTIHQKINPHKCFTCGKTFVSANTLKIHRKIHSGIKPFICSYFKCGRAFVTKSTLESHIRTHTGEKPYNCGYCESSFTTSSAKYRHERHVHKAHPAT